MINVYVYYRSYCPISSADQRQKYKLDFNQEYEEYREIHDNVQKVSNRFADLEARMKKAKPGSEDYEVRGITLLRKIDCKENYTFCFLW